MIVDGYPLIAVPTLSKACPTHQIMLVSVLDGEEELERDRRGRGWDSICRWVFGPGTYNEWPYGDYYAGALYIEQAFQDYHSFHNKINFGGKFYAIDTALMMDVGL